jgi:hypothetical protein
MVAPTRLIRQPAAPSQPSGSCSSRYPITAITGGRSCARVTAGRQAGREAGLVTDSALSGHKQESSRLVGRVADSSQTAHQSADRANR